MDKKYVITITRQFGSMGRPIGRKLAERLKIGYYDRDIMDLTAKKMNVPVSVIGELEESVQGKFFRMKYPLGMGNGDMQNEIFETQKNIIKSFAEKESCIVVGRCSDYVLREFPNSFHIYIYAPSKFRFETCIKDFDMQPDEAKKMMLEVDKARERYHRQYAGYLPSDCNYKHLMIDSSFLGIEGTADYLEDFVKHYLKKHGNE